MSRKLIALFACAVVVLGLAVSGQSTASAENTTAPTSVTGTQTIVVEGFDWGPAVTKTIVTLDQQISADSVTAESFAVLESKETFNWAALGDPSQDPTVHTVLDAPRTVLAAYTCDADGQATGDSNQIALELRFSPDEGSPYIYDFIIGHNSFCNPYNLQITLTADAALTTADGCSVAELTVDPSLDASKVICSQLENVDLSGTFTGTDGKALAYGSFVPADDGQKHPLVIWLHGAGEGGTDPSVVALGNKVTALYGEEFQTVMGGAYVLTPQTPTFWMAYNEEGAWNDNPGVSSIYQKTLMELIENYVQSNPNIDANRIYIGGCSNGGYMTMDLILNYPDYFAAAFPICEAYADAGITDEQLKGIQNLPVWFVYAKNDTTVVPESYEIPTIARLQSMGADIHTSVFDDVHDTTGLYTGQDGSAYQYMGHWSWLYFFNNECEDDGVNMWQWLTEQSK